MNNLYKLLNVSSDMQFGNLLDKLDLNPNELVCLESISNNFQYSMDEKRQMILEMLAGSDNNYQIMKNQFKKSNEPRRLKESVTQSSPMNMNDVLELNELIELSYSKCNDNPKCAQDVYQMINKALGKNVADAYFSMVRNSVNTEDNLKFDTDLVIDGKNVAESILTIKSNIINYLNGIENKQKSDEKLSESTEYKSSVNPWQQLQFILSNEEKNSELYIKANNIYTDYENGKIDEITAKTRLGNLVMLVQNKLWGDLTEDTVYDQSWYKVKGGKYPRKTKEGIICEEELTTLNRIAGVYDINNNSFKELGKGEEHNLTLKDYNNGNVRYQIQESYNNVNCDITAIDRGYAYQTMKKIKSKYKDVNIDTFNLEFRTDDGKKMFIKLDNNGHQIFENKNIEHFTSEEIHNKLVQERKQLKETYDSLINDLEDAEQMLYSTNRKSKYVDIINRYLKPYHKTIADLTWTGDFIDIIGEEQAQEAVDELYSINETCSAGVTCAGSVATVSKPMKSKKKRKLSIKEMSEFPKITQLTESENYRKYAGIFDLNKNSLFYLPQNTHHMNFIHENDVFNGKVRFGVAEYKSNVVGYICSDTREHIMKVLKILKKEFNNLPISYWMIEYFEDGERVRMNIDDSGKTIYENKNHWFPSWNNIKNKIIQETQINRLPLSTQIFIDMIQSNNNSYNVYNGNSYRFNDGYFYKNGQLVKTKNLNEMVEFVLGNIELPILEGFLPSHLDMLLETELDNEITYDDLTPEQRQMKQQEETELQNELNTSDSVKVSVKDSNDENKLETDQELIGVDNSDEQNKKYVVKNPSSNEIKIMNYNEIELQK